jgi:N,N-dimethylformamidase
MWAELVEGGMEVIGYTDRLSATAGETVQVKVSTAQTTYRADIVRLRRPFRRADPANDQVIESDVNGEYPGRMQAIPIGSYLRLPDLDAMNFADGWTFQCWIAPSLPRRGAIQGIVSRWNGQDQTGFRLILDEEGYLQFQAGLLTGVIESVRSPEQLIAGRWYFVAARIDRDAQTIALELTMARRGWLPEETSRVMKETAPLSDMPGVEFLMAASHLRPIDGGRVAPHHCYNGKIDRPRCWARPLSDDEIATLRSEVEPLLLREGLVAAWDLSRDISTSSIHDASPHGHHGYAVNMPMRAVVGANWDGSALDFALAPAQYGAIAFHEDDLADCGWQTDFEVTVPDHWPSGIYAVRLQSGGTFDYVSFYVRRPHGQPAAPILFLAPTNTYLAYGNEKLFAGMEADPDFIEKSTDHDIELTERDLYLQAHPELGASTYDRHPDGSGISHSTRLRPVLTMRPEFINWLNGCHRHFSADLYLIDWLESQGFDYEVATDEDLHVEGLSLLEGHRVVVTGGHPEYWSTAMLDVLEDYLSSGGKLMYLGGNGFYWVTGISPSAPHLVEIRRGINGTRSWSSHPGEITLSSTVEPGGLWRNRCRGPNTVVGIGFASEGWGGAPGYTRLPDSFDPRVAFIFDGIGEQETIGEFGLVMGGAAGDEIDRWDLDLGTPPETLRLATSQGKHSDYYQVVIEDCNFMLPGRGGTEDTRVRADITYLEGPGGGAVFSTGSINWIGSLMWEGGNNNVSRMTGNVLRGFAAR